MNNQYQLIIRLQTAAGEQTAGQFYIGNVKDRAYELFGQLEGRDVSDHASFIYVELKEIENGLPVNLKIISCNLEEAARNIKKVLKHLFATALL